MSMYADMVEELREEWEGKELQPDEATAKMLYAQIKPNQSYVSFKGSLDRKVTKGFLTKRIVIHEGRQQSAYKKAEPSPAKA